MDEISIDPATAARLTATYGKIVRIEESFSPTGERLTSPEKLDEYKSLRTVLASSLLNLRKQIGEHRLKLALAKASPTFPWEYVEELLNAALNCHGDGGE
jgi:hypothetical protein